MGKFVLFCSGSECIKGRNRKSDITAAHSEGFHINNEDIGLEILNPWCIVGMTHDLCG